MKLRNRIFSIIMVIVILATSVAVFAEDTATNTDIIAEETGTKIPELNESLYGKLLLLEALGLFEDMNELNLDAPVTRATYAGWLEKVANLTGEKAYTPVEFSDVDEKHAQYDAIQNVVSAGYMSGMGGSIFMPSAVITLSDAAVSLVRLTGREVYALVKGGYPTGYETTARSMRLYEGVKSENTTINVLLMIYNALNSEYLVPNGISSHGVIYGTSETVLSFFHNVYEIEGTMTANGFTKLYSDAIISNPESVEIDKVVYKIENSELNDLLGMYVQGYYHYDQDTDERTLVSAYANGNDNTVMHLPSKDLRLVGHTLYYPIENGAREKKVELIAGFDFIYNNRAVPTRADADILIADGELTLIDQDNDRKFDVVIAKDRITDRITGLDTNRIAVYTETMALEAAESENSVMILKMQDKATGKISECMLDELYVGMVVTVYRSLDKMYTEIIATDNGYEGTPTALGEFGTIFFDEEEFEFARPSEMSNLVIGMYSTLSLDYLGRIAYVERTPNLDYEYGYVFSIKEDFEQEAWVIKLLTSYGERKYKVHTKVMIDGVSGCAPSSLPAHIGPYEIIRYRLDKNECIRNIDTENNVGGAPYDARHNKLTKIKNQETVFYNIDGPSLGEYSEYLIGRQTFIITAPTASAEKADPKNYSQSIEVPDRGNQTFTIYDQDPETLECGVIIRHTADSVVTPSVHKNSPTVVVKKVFKTWEDGEDVLKIEAMQNGVLEEFVCSDAINEAAVMAAGFGDVISYATDTEGKVAAINIDFDANEMSMSRSQIGSQAYGSDYRYDYGRLLRRLENWIVFEQGSTGNTVTASSSGMKDGTLVDFSERKISGIDKNYYATYVANSETPSYIYVALFRNKNLNELVVYKY